MSKKRSKGVQSNTQKVKSAYIAHKKAAKKAKAPPKPTAAATAAALRQRNQKAPPPFLKSDNVLLVGEGDFSFSLSLRKHLGVKKITATCLDTEAQLVEKYPQARAHIDELVAPEADEDLDIDPDGTIWEDGEQVDRGVFAVEYAVDATKLLKRRMFKTKKFDRIVFQFPHVGGQSKDQDRQVRYNQELLLGFFKCARPLLTPDTGTVVVTLFEGMPYELWNIRKLAKEAGLLTKLSMKFDADEYVGYKHVRTLGNIEGGGAWKAEDRKARTYVFGMEPAWTVANRKRMARDSDDD